MPTKFRRRKKKKGSRFITGTYTSSKCTSGPIKYRSSWELVVCLFLDEQADVVSYGYECIKIPYVSNVRSKKTRNYIPDFVVEYKDGSKLIIEVKNKRQLANVVVVKKANAGTEWAKQNGMTYTFWTEKEILPLRKHYASEKPELFPIKSRKKAPNKTKTKKAKKLTPSQTTKKLKAIQKPLKLPWV